ncbi:MAG: hypothetical protein HUJ51_00160 [Eggerthellaceae bacterium]|nr:hypothetical protein [Eggerthellaceae bacterium]
MTLIITLGEAIIFTGLRFALPEWSKKLNIGILALIFVGACLMWSADFFFCVLAGEDFIDFADTVVLANDCLLSFCVFALGISIWAVYSLVKSNKHFLDNA